MAATGDKYTIKALDGVVGANSAELRDKILKQLPLDSRKTKELALNLQLAEGERTELVENLQTDDGMTNGAANIIRKIQLHDRNRPSGIIYRAANNFFSPERTYVLKYCAKVMRV